MSGSVNVAFKNTGLLTVQTNPLYCGLTSEIASYTGEKYAPGSTLPLTPGFDWTAVNACTLSAPKSIVGAVFWAPGAIAGDTPVAWYFYDFVAKSVVAQQSSPLVNLTAVPTVNTKAASVLSLTVNSSIPPFDPLPQFKDWMEKYWWVVLIAVVVLIALVLGIVMSVRRRKRGGK